MGCFLPAVLGRAAARWIQNHGGEQHLLQLRMASTEEARKFLSQIPGIGNKVSLFKLIIIPKKYETSLLNLTFTSIFVEN